MNPLFPEKILGSVCLGNLEAVLTLDSDNTSTSHPLHSWNFDENFPNEVDPDDLDQVKGRVSKVTAPVISFDDTLLISLKENSLEVSPIFPNIIAKEILKRLSAGELNKTDVIILGTSDQITCLKAINDTSSSLQPPEFVTGFVGAVLTQLIESEIPFQGVIAPSEGPIGFEKLTLVTMEELIETCTQWVSVDKESYRDECYRRWKLDGKAAGAQSGLYI